MKFKTRIQVLLVICILPIIALFVYFHRFQKEVEDPANFIRKNGLYRKDVFYRSSTRNAPIVPKKDQAREIPELPINRLQKRNSRVAAMVGLRINAKLREMNFTTNPSHVDAVINCLKDLQSDVKSSVLKDVNLPWKIAEGWVNHREIYPENPVGLGNVLKALSTFRILKAEVPSKGSQLKLLLTLEGNQSVIFKPMRLSRNHIVLENPYAGPDRHNGEIVAFHLNRLLGFRKVPIAVGRKINLSKEKEKFSSKLLKTFSRGDEGETCFYGVCYYCRPSERACSDSLGLMEGAAILWLPNRPQFILKKLRNPWRRTYKKNVTARWESEIDYCQKVTKNSPFIKYENLILEIIDVSILDYLIGNADRHTLELFAYDRNASLIFIDNGKSLGNPFWDELTILAPLYQCCRVYERTFNRLLLFADSLASSLDQITKFDPAYPLLTSSHLEAIDRRLRVVLATIELCFQKDGRNKVLRN